MKPLVDIEITADNGEHAQQLAAMYLNRTFIACMDNNMLECKHLYPIEPPDECKIIENWFLMFKTIKIKILS